MEKILLKMFDVREIRANSVIIYKGVLWKFFKSYEVVHFTLGSSSSHQC